MSNTFFVSFWNLHEYLTIEIPLRNALLMSTTFASNPSSIICVKMILMVTSFITGEKCSVKSSPGIWLNPLATNLALLTHLRHTNLLFAFHSTLFTSLHTPIFIILLNSSLIALFIFLLHFYPDSTRLAGMFVVNLDHTL